MKSAINFKRLTLIAIGLLLVSVSAFAQEAKIKRERRAAGGNRRIQERVSKCDRPRLCQRD